MGFGGWMDWALAIILLGVAGLLFAGKGDFILFGGKGQNKKRLEKEYDYPKLVRATAVMALCLGLIELVMAFVGDGLVWLTYAYVPVTLCVFVGGVIWIHKCKRK